MREQSYKTRDELIEAVSNILTDLCEQTLEEVCNASTDCTECSAERTQMVTKLLTGAEIKDPHIHRQSFQCDGSGKHCDEMGCHQHVAETMLKNATLRHEIYGQTENPLDVTALCEDPAGYLYTQTPRRRVPSCTDCYFIARDTNEHPCNQCSTVNITMSRDYYITEEEGSRIYHDDI